MLHTHTAPEHRQDAHTCAASMRQVTNETQRTNERTREQQQQQNKEKQQFTRSKTIIWFCGTLSSMSSFCFYFMFVFVFARGKSVISTHKSWTKTVLRSLPVPRAPSAAAICVTMSPFFPFDIPALFGAAWARPFQLIIMMANGDTKMSTPATSRWAHLRPETWYDDHFIEYVIALQPYFRLSNVTCAAACHTAPSATHKLNWFRWASNAKLHLCVCVCVRAQIQHNSPPSRQQKG